MTAAQRQHIKAALDRHIRATRPLFGQEGFDAPTHPSKGRRGFAQAAYNATNGDGLAALEAAVEVFALTGGAAYDERTRITGRPRRRP